MASSQTACQICVRRRIKCDLERPSCRKCRSRGLVCPGYGRRLRWVGGVAARGHLKGQATPSRNHQASAPAFADRDHRTLVSGSSRLEYNGTFGLFDAPQRCLSQTSNLLLDYYDKKIAGTMVWLDSAENEYRRCAIPLARSKPGLLFAIMALSAHHGSETILSENAHNESLAAMQRVAQHLSHRLSSGDTFDEATDPEHAEWLLASSMVLSNYHIRQSSIEASDCHRRAAGVFSNIFKSTNARHGRLFHFLQNQLAICDVLAATTLFNAPDNAETIRPFQDAGNEPFADYLRLLHKVTLESRRGITDAYFQNPASIRTSFEQAKATTLQAAGRLHLTPGHMSRDFARLVNVYHDAALLYAYRTLGLNNGDESAASEHEIVAAELFVRLNEFEEQSRWAHNLPWPAFIAGVESYHNEWRQVIVERLFATIVQCTGFSHYLEAIRFLRTFWEDDDPDWRPLARKWELEGRRLILY